MGHPLEFTAFRQFTEAVYTTEVIGSTACLAEVLFALHTAAVYTYDNPIACRHNWRCHSGALRATRDSPMLYLLMIVSANCRQGVARRDNCSWMERFPYFCRPTASRLRCLCRCRPYLLRHALAGTCPSVYNRLV